MTRLILDPSVFTESFPGTTKLELYSTELIYMYNLHRNRISEREQGLANPNLNLTMRNSKSVPAVHTGSNQNQENTQHDGSPTSQRPRF